MNRTPINGWWYPHSGDGVSGTYQGVGDAIIGASGYQVAIPALFLDIAGSGLMPISYEGASWTFLDGLPEIGEEVRVNFRGFSHIPTIDGHIRRPVYEVSKL